MSLTTPSDPRDEVLDVVDDDDRVVGQARREDIYAKRLRHRVAVIVVRDPAGLVLVHRRTPTKLVAPSMHDMMVGGVVDAGESYDAAAARELAEEVGVTGVPLRPVVRVRYDGTAEQAPWPQWVAVYETTWAGSVVAQESEVAWWGWLEPDQIDARLGDGTWCADSVEVWRAYRAATGG